jgi:glutathione synthase/RimK-type ligase-like ATP-grasp enzyme
MIAIHKSENSFSDRWIQYCKSNKIEFITVNIYDSNIIIILRQNNVQVLFAHLELFGDKIKLTSKAILLNIEKSGVKVFPDHNTFFSYDDKLSQKYVFEALQIPHAPTHVFYNKKDAKQWLSDTAYPIVFKLRCGSRSSNVVLLKNKKCATLCLNKMFGRGIKPVSSAFYDFKTKIHAHSHKRDWAATIKRLPNTLKYTLNASFTMSREKNYYLVQEFMPGNSFDTRVVIIGNKAIAFRRHNRPNDFRASGSMNADLNQEKINKSAILLSFEAANKIGSQSMAFDILCNVKNKPVLIEMSYTCPSDTIFKVGGYWDSSLVFHNDPVCLEEEIISQVLASCQ